VVRGARPGEVSAVLPSEFDGSFDGSPTAIDSSAVEQARQAVIAEGTKGMPPAATGMTLAELGATGWRVLDGSFPMPLMVLRQSALETNIAAMAAYCRQNGVWLSPHGKTTMAPQLFQRQIEAGAWAMTAATPTHLRLYRRFGVQRVVYANELVEPAVIEWLAAELARDPGFDFYCLADSVDGVAILSRELDRHGVARPVRVLVEVGYAGGRCGVRDGSTARAVAQAIDRAPSLELRGVECFEGLLGHEHGMGQIDAALASVRDVAVDLLAHTSLPGRDEVVVTAGGSSYFDRVIEALVSQWDHPSAARVVLRSGCYITQDGGMYRNSSPLDQRPGGTGVLREGIEVWGTVLSRPEPGLVICGLGRRDASEDHGLPIPHSVCQAGGSPAKLTGARVVGLNDQHAHIVVDPGCSLRPGDLVGCSISHPCTTFDRWRVIPVVDDDYIIRDALATFF
jgi:D-serine deaminase-like pyridoxal phosphate-dependent protein